jgi:hypothetical protein
MGYEPNEIIGAHLSWLYPPPAVACGWPEFELRRPSPSGASRGRGGAYIVTALVSGPLSF